MSDAAAIEMAPPLARMMPQLPPPLSPACATLPLKVPRNMETFPSNWHKFGLQLRSTVMAPPVSAVFELKLQSSTETGDEPPDLACGIKMAPPFPS
jgi:hypothetical protein